MAHPFAFDPSEEVLIKTEEEDDQEGASRTPKYRLPLRMVAGLGSVATVGLMILVAAHVRTGWPADTTPNVRGSIGLAAQRELARSQHGGPCADTHVAFEKLEHIIRDLSDKGKLNSDKLMKLGQEILGNAHSGSIIEHVQTILNEADLSEAMNTVEILTMEDLLLIDKCEMPDGGHVDDNSQEHLLETDLMPPPAHYKGKQIWGGGHIVYCFHSSCDKHCKEVVHAAIVDITKQVPCIKFTASATANETCTAKSAVLVRGDKNGCYSWCGMVGGTQDLNVAKGCQFKGIVTHEFLHALGVEHEQKRSDRDKYVDIKWENLAEGKERQFKKSPSADTGELYDILSVMHYGHTYFSKNGQTTIATKPEGLQKNLGQRMGMSQLDAELLCKMYGCSATCKPSLRNEQKLKDLLGIAQKAPATGNGCMCMKNWKMRGRAQCTTEANEGCCNPDNSEKGTWCFTQGKCDGKDYDECTVPAKARAPKTNSGCECKHGWRYWWHSASESNGWCFNPSGDYGGPWCYTSSKCAGKNWDYCHPK